MWFYAIFIKPLFLISLRNEKTLLTRLGEMIALMHVKNNNKRELSLLVVAN